MAGFACFLEIKEMSRFKGYTFFKIILKVRYLLNAENQHLDFCMQISEKFLRICTLQKLNVMPLYCQVAEYLCNVCMELF